MKAQSGTPHGVGHFWFDQFLAFFGPPIPNRTRKLYHAQVGYGLEVFVVVFDVRHVGGKDGVIVLGPMVHGDQSGIVIVVKIHVRIDLHTKIVFLHGRQLDFFMFVSVGVIPIHHGRQFAPGVGGSFRFTRIDLDDLNVVLVLVAVGIVFVAIDFPTPRIVDKVTGGFDLDLIEDPYPDPFWVGSTSKDIVESPSAQTIPKGRNQDMNGSFHRSLLRSVLGVVIMRTFIVFGAFVPRENLVSKGSVGKELAVFGVVSCH